MYRNFNRLSLFFFVVIGAHFVPCGVYAQKMDKAHVLVPGNLYTLEAVTISAQQPGVVQSVVRLGSVVEIGETVIQLDRELPLARVAAAEKEFEIAKIESRNDVDLRFARISSKVNQQVLERSLAANRQYKKALSKTEIERLRLDYQRTCLSAEQAQRTGQTNELTAELRRAQVDIAKIELMNQTIESPLAGTVTEVQVQSGEWVNVGQPVLRIVRTNKLRFTGLVDSREVLPNEIAELAKLLVDYQGNINASDESIDFSDAVDVKILFVNPEIDPASGLYEIRAEVDNSEQKMFSGLKSLLKLEKKKNG